MNTKQILQVMAAAPLLLFGAAGCHESSPGISVNIAAQVRDTAGGNVDLAKAFEGDWERVCILAPYADNAAARAALGFDWDAEGKTAIHGNDGIALLLFVHAGKVAAFAEHPRNLGDFASLPGQCFPRAQARFYQRQASKQAAAGMYPKGRP